MYRMWYICVYIDLYMYFVLYQNLKYITVAGTKKNKRYNCKNCDLVKEKTCDVKLLSAKFSQEAHRNANFLIILYELFSIGYHHK